MHVSSIIELIINQLLNNDYEQQWTILHHTLIILRSTNSTITIVIVQCNPQLSTLNQPLWNHFSVVDPDSFHDWSIIDTVVDDDGMMTDDGDSPSDTAYYHQIKIHHSEKQRHLPGARKWMFRRLPILRGWFFCVVLESMSIPLSTIHH